MPEGRRILHDIKNPLGFAVSPFNKGEQNEKLIIHAKMMFLIVRCLQTKWCKLPQERIPLQRENWITKYAKQNQINNTCPDDGIGRHARLKIWWPQGREGSSPSLGTKRKLPQTGNFFYFQKLVFSMLLIISLV